MISTATLTPDLCTRPRVSPREASRMIGEDLIAIARRMPDATPEERIAVVELGVRYQERGR